MSGTATSKYVCLQGTDHAHASIGPFTHEVSQVLRLHNSNSDPVAFKVKTTAPKQYALEISD